MMIKYVFMSVVAAAMIPCQNMAEEGSDQERIAALEEQVKALSDEMKAQRELDALASVDPFDKFRFGGYGEIHANFTESGDSMLDIHRLVMYLGYDFSDWIRLNSEVEIEHAYVKDKNGELSIEQLYVDFMLSDLANARAGRMLTPMGIVNPNHEPPLFFGVERPNVEKYIIPSTWSFDGAGIFASPVSWLSYEAYVGAGLDGSKFGDDGIRGGRMKERPGLNDPALTGRLDFFPFSEADFSASHDLRLGLSGFYGGTDNQNKGGGQGVNNTFSMYSIDCVYEFSRLQLRGLVAQGFNSDADALNEGRVDDYVGDEIFGWYLEAGVNVLPNSWKQGKLSESKLIPFVRYEEYDTHYQIEDGLKNGANDRTEVTLGVNFLLTPQFVLKADYQIMDDESGSDRDNKFNLGMGWAFN